MSNEIKNDINIVSKDELKEFWNKVEHCIEKTLGEQLLMLAERSKICESNTELVELTMAMTSISQSLRCD